MSGFRWDIVWSAGFAGGSIGRRLLNIEWQRDAVGLEAGEAPSWEVSVGLGSVDEFIELDWKPSSMPQK